MMLSQKQFLTRESPQMESLFTILTEDTVRQNRLERQGWMGKDLTCAKQEKRAADRMNGASRMLGWWEAPGEAGSSVTVLPGTCFVASG